MRHAITIFAFFAAALATNSAGASERIEIKSGDVTLRGMLYRPAGAERSPAVVAMHGCSGLWERSGAITERFKEWGERLQKAGFVVLFPDSFGSRGLGAQCTVRKRTVRVSRERVNDANAARRWLQSQPFVDPERVSLLGWSNGATAALWTVRDNGAKPPPKDEFRSAVVLYPGCRELRKATWTARVPTLLLLGGADDWTAAATCQEMVTDGKGRGALATVITYPGAYHDFDRANFPVRQRKNLAFTANDSGVAHLGTDEQARADAIKRVPEWFAR